jgi:hypothetical protein
MASVATVQSIPWWKEPTKDQWLAWVAAWLAKGSRAWSSGVVTCARQQHR